MADVFMIGGANGAGRDSMAEDTQASLHDKIILGIEASAVVAVERARQTGTKLVVWRNGMIVEITPDEVVPINTTKKPETV